MKYPPQVNHRNPRIVQDICPVLYIFFFPTQNAIPHTLFIKIQKTDIHLTREITKKNFFPLVISALTKYPHKTRLTHRYS